MSAPSFPPPHHRAFIKVNRLSPARGHIDPHAAENVKNDVEDGDQGMAGRPGRRDAAQAHSLVNGPGDLRADSNLPQDTASTTFFRSFGLLVEIYDQCRDATTKSIWYSCLRSYFFSSAGRVVWAYFTAEARDSLIYTWQLQLSDQNGSFDSLDALAACLARFKYPMLQATAQRQESEKAIRVKSRLFDTLIAMTRAGARDFGYFPAEMVSDLSDFLDQDCNDDVFEALCLSLITFPSQPLFIESSHRWIARQIDMEPFVEDLKECAREDGFVADPRARSSDPDQAQRSCLGRQMHTLSPMASTFQSAAPLSREGMAGRSFTATGREARSPANARNGVSVPLVAQAMVAPPTNAVGVMPALYNNDSHAGLRAYHDRFNRVTTKLQVKASAISQQAEIATVESSLGYWQTQLYNAMCSQPDNGSAKEAAAAKSWFSKLRNMETDSQVVMVGLSCMILDTVIKTHKNGTTLHIEERKRLSGGAAKEFLEEDMELGIVDRLNAIVAILRDRKLIVSDCEDNERKIHALAWAPNAVLAGKDRWSRLNGNKAELTKTMKAETGRQKRSRRGANQQIVEGGDQDDGDNGITEESVDNVEYGGGDGDDWDAQE